VLYLLHIPLYNNVGVNDDCHPILEHCYKPHFTADMTQNSLISELIMMDMRTIWTVSSVADDQHYFYFKRVEKKKIFCIIN